MKATDTINGLKNNAKEFAEKLDNLFKEFNANDKVAGQHHSIILMTPEEIEKDNIDKSKLIAVDEGEYYLMLVNDEGEIIDISNIN